MMDQYSIYEKLPVLLKRYTFSEKVRICHKYSNQLLQNNKDKSVGRLTDKVLPWNIETFFLFAVESMEYGSNDFVGKNENHFIKMTNTIWNKVPNVLSEKQGEFDFIDYLLPLTALTQFDFQSYSWYKYFRYNELFSFTNIDLDMKKEFMSVFDIDYSEFLTFGICLDLILNLDVKEQYSIIKWLVEKRFITCSSHLIISRAEYVNQIHKYSNTNDKSSYIYCVRPSYQYPFVYYDNQLFFPLPHLLPMNITSSLLYRLTEGNNSLRSSIGKYALESYLVMLITESCVFDEVFSAQEYRSTQGANAESPDVLARIGENIVLFESKSSVPNSKIRLLFDDMLKVQIQRAAENIVQLYKQAKVFKRYNPFITKENIEFDNIWGIVVVLEDSFIRRELIYKSAACLAGFQIDSIEYNWLIKHIKIVDLYDIERWMMISYNFVDDLIKNENPYDYTGNSNKILNKSISIRRFDNFRTMYIEKAKDALMSYNKRT